MKAEDKRYEEVVNILKSSRPVLADPEVMAEQVIRRIQNEKSRISLPELIFNYLFGWVYIGWVRRSLIVATLAIIVIFSFQQAIILKRIDDLSGQRIQNGTTLMTGMKEDYTGKLQMFKFSGGKLSDPKSKISEKEIDEMINSIYRLQVKYKDIINLIEDDPGLKKYVEDRMNEIGKK